MKKRLDYFDVAKGIGSLLVLIGHLQAEEIRNYSPYILPMCQWIFSFHMPFFFIISGMLIAYKNDTEKDYKTLVKKRFKGIMVPYYWFSFFYMTTVVFAYFRQQIGFGVVNLNLWYVLSGYGMRVLWFLPALFLAEILFIFIMKKLSVKMAVIVMTVQAAVAYYFSYRNTLVEYDTTYKEVIHNAETVVLRPFIACTFIAIGYFAFKLTEQLGKRLAEKKQSIGSETEIIEKRKVNWIEVAVAVVLLAIGFIFMWINIEKGSVDFRSLVFRNVPVYYLCSLSTSFGLILICKNIRPFKILKFWGVNSLIFMAVHGTETVLYFAIRLAMRANQYLTTARGYICYAIILSIVLIYVCIMILFINRFVPFIIGKPFTNPFKKKEKTT